MILPAQSLQHDVCVKYLKYYTKIQLYVQKTLPVLVTKSERLNCLKPCSPWEKTCSSKLSLPRGLPCQCPESKFEQTPSAATLSQPATAAYHRSAHLVPNTSITRSLYSTICQSLATEVKLISPTLYAKHSVLALMIYLELAAREVSRKCDAEAAYENERA